MTENPNQPRDYDAVLGGQILPPQGSAILGGLEGVKSRLASAVVEQRAAALKEALNYGGAGLDLVIQAWKDESGPVKRVAYSLLREQKYNPWLQMKCLRTLKGHSASVRSVVISPDGKTIVSGSQDESFKLWDLQTGQQLSTIRRHSSYIHAVTISADGQKLIIGNKDKTTIEVWDLQTGQEIRTLTGHSDWVNSVAISADGHTLISGSRDNTIKVWNLRTGQELCTLTGHLGSVNSVAIFADGHTLLSGSDDTTIKVWGVL